MNMYYQATGADGKEKIIHTGPNLWIGIFALLYFIKTADSRGLTLAKAILNLTQLTSHSNGAVAMGRAYPYYSIYATEHNIDYYAFLRLLLPYLNAGSEYAGTVRFQPY